MARKIIILIALLLTTVLFAIVYIRPHSANVMRLDGADSLYVAPVFEGPSNIKISIEAGVVCLNWDKVPGAIGYNVYYADPLPDSTNTRAYCEYKLDVDGNGLWALKHIKPMRFGDVYLDTPAYGYYMPKMWNQVNIASWIKANSQTIVDCSYSEPGSADIRIYKVTALR